MTKVDAIKKALVKNGGSATLQQLYKLTPNFKKDIKQATDWQAGLRGVLYREVRNGRNFKRVNEAEYALI